MYTLKCDYGEMWLQEVEILKLNYHSQCDRKSLEFALKCDYGEMWIVIERNGNPK